MILSNIQIRSIRELGSPGDECINDLLDTVEAKDTQIQQLQQEIMVLKAIQKDEGDCMDELIELREKLNNTRHLIETMAWYASKLDCTCGKQSAMVCDRCKVVAEAKQAMERMGKQDDI
jgi:DNA repair ATPase RecN